MYAFALFQDYLPSYGDCDKIVKKTLNAEIKNK